MEFARGYVGTLEAETRDVARVWFSLTAEATGSDWVKIGGPRAWFTMSMESADRPTHMAQLTLLLEAMRHELEVEVRLDGETSFHRRDPHDTFKVNGVRVLRTGLHF
jgi:hypothetical protein